MKYQHYFRPSKTSITARWPTVLLRAFNISPTSLPILCFNCSVREMVRPTEFYNQDAELQYDDHFSSHMLTIEHY